MDKRSSVSALCSPLAKYSEMASCPSLRTLTPKRFFFWSRGSIFARWSTQTRISMGSSETEVKELAVMPWILPGSRSTVTTVTPVVKWPSALRNSKDESGGGGILEVFEDTILGAGKAKRRIRIVNAQAAIRMSGRIPNGVNIHGAKNHDTRRNGSGRLRAGVSPGEGRGVHFDRFAGCRAGAGNGQAVARTHWRRSADRRPGQSFRSGSVRCRGVDSSLLRGGRVAQAIENHLEAGNNRDRYDRAAGGDGGRRGDAHSGRVARISGRADEGAFAGGREFGGGVSESWRGCTCWR